MISRRNLFKSGAALGAAAVAASVTSSPLAWAEPARLSDPDGPIRLNSNENAYGAFPSVLALGNPFLESNRYPFKRDQTLQERIAAKHKVSADRVLMGCGSTEILKLAVATFTAPDKKLVMASPTFEAAAMHAKASGAPVTTVPLTGDYSHDLDAMLRASDGAGLVYICNPNNPTASLTSRKDIENFVAKVPRNTYVLIDEAYHDFVPASADYISFLDAPVDSDRVIVARTFSKVYGMAGLRLGYGIGSADAMKQMEMRSQSDSINIFAIRCALAALDDENGHRMAVERNARDRDEFMRQITARKLMAIPSSANFLMVNAHRPVQQVEAHFRQNNIEVGRPFPPYTQFVRVSLGTPEQMQAYWRAWDQMPAVQ